MSRGRRHTVSQGESVESIAVAAGHFWQTVWEHAENSDLRELRHSPHVLLPGDVVFVPEIELRHESKPTTQRHRFKRKGVPSKLRVRFMIDNQPRANAAYELDIDGTAKNGTTDGDGWLDEPVSPFARRATVRFDVHLEDNPDHAADAFEGDGDDIVREDGAEVEADPAPDDAAPTRDVYVFNLRHMDPTSTLSGAQGRLLNLGYFVGAIDGQMSPRTHEALRAFQHDQGIEETGELDDATQSKLAEFADG